MPFAILSIKSLMYCSKSICVLGKVSYEKHNISSNLYTIRLTLFYSFAEECDDFVDKRFNWKQRETLTATMAAGASCDQLCVVIDADIFCPTSLIILCAIFIPSRDCGGSLLYPILTAGTRNGFCATVRPCVNSCVDAVMNLSEIITRNLPCATSSLIIICLTLKVEILP